MTQLFNNKAACFGCGACAAVCSQNAITMAPDSEGFPYPVVDAQTCVDCGACGAVCPANAPAEGMDGTAYAVRCNDIPTLQLSSSGGAFSLMADQVLKMGGLVCGAAFDEDFRVCHVLCEEIAPMRKAKYVQSDLTGIYDAIAAALGQGRTVLFTGTPCQCDGVRKYFGGARAGLILAALLCRGVQSPGLWAEYVAHLEQAGRLEAYCFRDKRAKNDAHTVAYTVGGQETALPMDNDPFSRLYLKCLTLRPSCYHCPYARWENPFDLTFGDFWGIEKVHPELNDGMGTSLMIARSEAARALVDGMRDQALVLESTREDALQPALTEPARETILRKLLFRDYARKDTSGHCDIPLILKKFGG